MARHVLIDRASRFPFPCEQDDVVGWAYRREIGAWVFPDDPDRLWFLARQGQGHSQVQGRTRNRRCQKKQTRRPAKT